MLGLCWPILGLSWPILGLCWPILGAMLGLCWPILGLSWPMLGLCWPILGAMLAHLGRYVGPCWPILGHKIRKTAKNGKSTKHRKTREFLAYRVGRRQGVPPLSPTERRETPYGNATARGPLAGFKRLRATAGQGPNYVGTFCGYVGLCWRMLAYLAGNVGPYYGDVGLCWPHVDPCGAKRSEKWEQPKKHCKTQDILMVGGLSWGYVGVS